MVVDNQSPNTSNNALDVTSSRSERWIPRHHKVITVTVVLIALVVATIIVLKPSHTGSGILDQAKVDISTTNFSPATLLIKPGTTVTWVNNDQAPHQVAADPFPKDNSIQGFDNGVVMQSHDTYSFTFGQKGTYTYHDERNPFQFQGKVIVQ